MWRRSAEVRRKEEVIRNINKGLFWSVIDGDNVQSMHHYEWQAQKNRKRGHKVIASRSLVA